MGELLSHPNKDKISEDGENEYVKFYNKVKIWFILYARMEK
jgi:hypothetical protein